MAGARGGRCRGRLRVTLARRVTERPPSGCGAAGAWAGSRTWGKTPTALTGNPPAPSTNWRIFSVRVLSAGLLAGYKYVGNREE